MNASNTLIPKPNLRFHNRLKAGLQEPVHVHLGWSAIVIATSVSLLLMGNAFAQYQPGQEDLGGAWRRQSNLGHQQPMQDCVSGSDTPSFPPLQDRGMPPSDGQEAKSGAMHANQERLEQSPGMGTPPQNSIMQPQQGRPPVGQADQQGNSWFSGQSPQGDFYQNQQPGQNKPPQFSQPNQQQKQNQYQGGKQPVREGQKYGRPGEGESFGGQEKNQFGGDSGGYLQPCPHGGKAGNEFNGQNNQSGDTHQSDTGQLSTQQLKMMNRNAAQILQQVKAARAYIAKLKTQGVNAPDDLTEALSLLEEAASKLQNAKTQDDIPDMQELHDAMQTVQEGMQKLNMSAQLPRQIKQAEKEIQRAEASFKSAQARATKAKIDVSVQLSEFNQALAVQKETLAKIKAQAQSDPEEALNALHEEFFQNMDTVWRPYGEMQLLLNITQGIGSMAKEIKANDARITALKSKKVDITDLAELQADLKAQFNKVKEISATKPLDMEALQEAVSLLGEKKQAVSDKLQEVTGDDGYTTNGSGQGQGFQFNIPQGF